MRVVAVGADHAGFSLKETLKTWLAGVPAVPCSDLDRARPSRRHHDAHALALGARTTSASVATAVLETGLATPFEGGRHATRVDQVAALERRPDPVRRGPTVPDEASRAPAR